MGEEDSARFLDYFAIFLEGISGIFVNNPPPKPLRTSLQKPRPGVSRCPTPCLWQAPADDELNIKPDEKRSEMAGSAACRCGSSLLAEAVPRWNSRTDSRAPRIQPSVIREDRVAARLARVMYRYRDCHQIERMIIHSDGGIDIRFRDPRPDHAHSSRSAVAHVGSMGPTTPRARPVLTPRQVKKNKRAADHQANGS